MLRFTIKHGGNSKENAEVVTSMCRAMEEMPNETAVDQRIATPIYMLDRIVFPMR